MKNKKVKISVVATAVALSMINSSKCRCSSKWCKKAPEYLIQQWLHHRLLTADVVEENGFQFDKPQELLPTIQAMKQEHLLFQAVLMELQ